MNRSIAFKFPAPVPYLPILWSFSTTLLVEIRLGYVLLVYSLWYFVSQPSAPEPLPHNPCYSHPCHVTHFLGSFPY